MSKSVTIKSAMVHWTGDPAVHISRRQDMDKGDSDNVSLISMGSHKRIYQRQERYSYIYRPGRQLMSLSTNSQRFY